MEQQRFLKYKLHFNLRQTKNRNAPTIIYGVFVYEGKQYKINTGVKVRPCQWCKEKEMPIISNIQSSADNRNNHIAINKLSQFKFIFDEILEYICNVSNLNVATEMKRRLKQSYKQIKTNKRMTQKEIVEWFNASIERVDKKTKSDGSKKQYRAAVRWLDKYLTSLESDGHPLNDISETAKLGFFYGMREWLFANFKNAKGESVNLSTIQKTIGTIHTLLKQACIDGRITNSDWINCKPHPLADMTSKDNQPFLMDNEVLAIYNYTPKNKTEEKVKDLFVLECTCGQRFGDIANLGKCVEIVGNNMIINCITEKESVRVQREIVFELAKEILKKYELNKESPIIVPIHPIFGRVLRYT